ncbi:MAG TPA: dephospho-CoA kinase [Xanthomonadaceae bacterium]|jgi:dephospho-CoA kinase|nr:dephospho-CoA kinase [Xanthomonadaceae bacterium]
MNSPPLVVAITGGIAAGKSEVSRRFEQLGIVVADADAVARSLVEPPLPALKAIVERFGSEVLQANGHLDRGALRRVVFDDERARRDLEAILHPRIRIALREACTASNSAYAMAAIPLLTEGGGHTTYPWVTRILLIDVPREVQLQRLLDRDGSSCHQALRILAAQATREQRLAIADDVIDNSGDIAALTPQVAKLHALYQSIAVAKE